ncbi:hypothetical protein [Aneurinibacillus migulanus]|uniref:Uncharacterized protein n=1 Tax=Aneurinibacillus migulanus TaxID=47500 RepID=A0A0D1XNB7_ANEMI|nr:hypothetical protein [Aneurinibacillus migulanus]KIV53648.1 hypothetical protein TS65_20385 [Aneurinibacillus migulanus]KON95455.1 hypothetical protein AF333_08110 [Aneurinibacillus migulanus]MED0892736.1 hypothetical protein [Aneurinibacillus migulanus]MED1616104.1 hypothetical protein [Aneurinibacillus migulanus]GED17978.1 hypothetical protein AMI01nite_59690 [Aneurinibacillus migulanus]
MTSISLPIKAHGKIIGAIELSKDSSQENQVSDHVIELKPELFLIHSVLSIWSIIRMKCYCS